MFAKSVETFMANGVLLRSKQQSDITIFTHAAVS